MESQATQELRERIRKFTGEQRESKRAIATDLSRFGLGVIQQQIKELADITKEDVQKWTQAIKHQRHATSEDMYRLSHAFLQSEDNINQFAHSSGVAIVVKELTGRNAARQLAASKLLCNFSLGNPATCYKIATMAGSYLITYLDSMDEQLKRTTIWTINNILATGGKGAQTLMHMELVSKLWSIYADMGSSEQEITGDEFNIKMNIDSHDNVDDGYDYRRDAAQGLLIISQSPILLRETDRQYLQRNFTAKNPTCSGSEYHLEIIFNCHLIDDTKQHEEQIILYVINYCIRNILHSNNYENDDNDNRRRMLYAVRLLANSLASQKLTYRLLLQQLYTTWQTTVLQFFNKLFGFNDVNLRRESLWLLRNFLVKEEEQQPSGFFNLHQSLDKLKIPIM